MSIPRNDRGRFKRGKWDERHSKVKSCENETKVVGWMHRWGFSTAKILTSIQGVSRSRTLKTIEKQGKITRERTYLASPVFAFRLTDLGLMLAEARFEESIEYPEINKERIVTSHFFHDLFTQALTLTAIKQGVCIDYATPRMAGLGGREREDRKIPDVVWQNSADQLFAVEVELNQKWEKRLDNFLAKTVESIESGEIHECLIITPSKATLRNYTKALEVKRIPVWAKKSGGIWRLDRDVEVRQIVADRIKIIYIPEYDMHRLISSLTVSGDIEIWMAERVLSDTKCFE